jgi:DNA polymerase
MYGFDEAAAIANIYNNTASADEMSSAIRSAIAGDLIVSDYSGIEGRVLPWLAGDTQKVAKIASGTDMYKVAAAAIYGEDYDSITKEQRTTGKIAELALGYQGAAGALGVMAAAYNIVIPPHQVFSIVSAWRHANPKIVNYWADIERAAKDCLISEEDRHINNVTFYMEGDFLRCRLPSGRSLSYHKPLLMGSQLTYMGMNMARKWVRLETYGGKLVENITQAVARDLLVWALRDVFKAGYYIRGTVHDEVITSKVNVTHNLEELNRILVTSPDWAQDLPLNVEGYEAPRYRK